MTPTYSVTLWFTGTRTYKVKASSAREAIKRAYDKGDSAKDTADEQTLIKLVRD